AEEAVERRAQERKREGKRDEALLVHGHDVRERKGIEPTVPQPSDPRLGGETQVEVPVTPAELAGEQGLETAVAGRVHLARDQRLEVEGEDHAAREDEGGEP